MPREHIEHDLTTPCLSARFLIFLCDFMIMQSSRETFSRSSTMLKSCPFCSLEDEDSDFLALHVDALHPEGGEPAVLGKSDQVAKPEVSDRPSLVNERQDALIDYIECPCGEFCLEAEFDSHLDMHNAEGTIFNEIEKSGLGSSNHRPFVQTAEVSEPKARAPSRQMEKVSVSIPYAPSAARKSTFSFSLGNRLGEYGNQDRSARSYLALEESEHRKPVKKPQRLGVGYLFRGFLNYSADSPAESGARSSCR